VGFLTGDTDRDHRNVRILLETISLGNSTIPFEAFLRSVVEKTLKMTGADRCLLMLLEGDELVVRAALDKHLETISVEADYSRSIPQQVIREGKAVVSLEDRGGITDPSTSMVEHDLRTVMCAPMRARDEVIGVLYVDSRRLLDQFSDSDLRLFRALSSLLASAIQHSRLLRAKQDLTVAGEIQRRLLPVKGLTIPGAEAFGISRPTEETGGDYFDYFSLEDGHLSAVIGDVSGHGIGAAMFVATARAVLRAHVAVERDPASVMEYVNGALARDSIDGRYMTLFYADLDLAKSRLTYCRAGHPWPLLYRAGNDSCLELGGEGFMAGAKQEVGYETHGPVELSPGDVLILFTDGITEAPRAGRRRGSLDLFGTDRIAAVVREHYEESAERIVKHVFQALDRFAGPGAEHDDRALLIVKLLPR
jgi:sigma-B regulation protein RsbU (phosphoserine phosphatase)